MKYININKIKKILNVKKRNDAVNRILDFIELYKLDIDRISIVSVWWDSDLVPYLNRRKKKIRKERRFPGRVRIDYVVCDGKCDNCPSNVKCSLILKEESIWD